MNTYNIGIVGIEQFYEWCDVHTNKGIVTLHFHHVEELMHNAYAGYFIFYNIQDGDSVAWSIKWLQECSTRSPNVVTSGLALTDQVRYQIILQMIQYLMGADTIIKDDGNNQRRFVKAKRMIVTVA